MGNEVKSLRKDLIDLDIEEMKINRELYILQLEINAKLANDKKVKVKKNFKQIAERKLNSLEQKKKLLFEKAKNIQMDDNNNNINENNKTENNKIYNAVIETGEEKNEDINNLEDNKLNLISNSSKASKNIKKRNIIDTIEKNNYKKNENNESNNHKKEMISNSESESQDKVKIIYTKKKPKNINGIDGLNENNSKNNKEGIQNFNNNDEDIKINDNNINNKEKNKNIDDNEDLEKNLNINQYKRKFFDKLSSLGPHSNINKSMDNKNSSIIEELEVVGLSHNSILKEKLSEFFVGTSVASSSNYNKNNSSMHNNYYNNRAKSEISGTNKQLISSNKSNDENNEYGNSINYNSNIKAINGENQEILNRGNEKRNKKGVMGEKFDTEETFNNKDTGNNTNEQFKEQIYQNEISQRKLLKNNRNKSYFVLGESSILENSSAKESNYLA